MGKRLFFASQGFHNGLSLGQAFEWPTWVVRMTCQAGRPLPRWVVAQPPWHLGTAGNKMANSPCHGLCLLGWGLESSKSGSPGQVWTVLAYPRVLQRGSPDVQPGIRLQPIFSVVLITLMDQCWLSWFDHKPAAKTTQIPVHLLPPNSQYFQQPRNRQRKTTVQRLYPAPLSTPPFLKH